MASVHTVAPGECLTRIAAKYGFADWRTLYDHPDNAELKRKRPNPNLLYPGDKIVIPEKRDKRLPAKTGASTQFKVGRPKRFVRVVMEDGDGQPCAGKRYEFKVGDRVYEGKTGSDGKIEQQVPADAVEGQLKVWFSEDPVEIGTWPLLIGHMDPVEELSGVQARLTNLGYACGKIDGVDGPKTQAAVKAFQRDHGLKVDGIPGPRTQAKLKEVYGC